MAKRLKGLTARQLQKLLADAGLSQVGAAQAVGVADRTMRKYISGELPVPRVVELALRYVIENAKPK